MAVVTLVGKSLREDAEAAELESSVDAAVPTDASSSNAASRDGAPTSTPLTGEGAEDPAPDEEMLDEDEALTEEQESGEDDPKRRTSRWFRRKKEPRPAAAAGTDQATVFRQPRHVSDPVPVASEFEPATRAAEVNGSKIPNGSNGTKIPNGSNGTKSPNGSSGTKSPNGSNGTKSPNGSKGTKSPDRTKSPNGTNGSNGSSVTKAPPGGRGTGEATPKGTRTGTPSDGTGSGSPAPDESTPMRASPDRHPTQKVADGVPTKPEARGSGPRSTEPTEPSPKALGPEARVPKATTNGASARNDRAPGGPGSEAATPRAPARNGRGPNGAVPVTRSASARSSGTKPTNGSRSVDHSPGPAAPSGTQTSPTSSKVGTARTAALSTGPAASSSTSGAPAKPATTAKATTATTTKATTATTTKATTSIKAPADSKVRSRALQPTITAEAGTALAGDHLDESAFVETAPEREKELGYIETAPERTERIALLLAEDPGPRRRSSTKAPIPLQALPDPGPSVAETRPTGQVIVLVPAHNEEDCIVETIESLHRQTTPVDRIIVICDNCTDRTEELIEPLDCDAFISKNNKQKKAGALNQALVPLLETLTDEDKVLVMDADSILDERFVEEATKILDSDPMMGAVSASYVGKQLPGFLPMMQRIEYAHGRRRNARRQARVTCLSGVACVLTMGALRHLISERGKSLPGQVDNPVAYLSVSLTEDFEITLALRVLGYKALGPKQCIAYTDLMPSTSMLWSQRLRWQRGTLETLRLYGVRKQTWRLYVQQVYTYLLSLASPLMIVLWLTSIFALHQGLQVSAWMFVLLPLSIIEQFIATFRMREWKATLLATTIVSMWLFDCFRSVIFWHALVKLMRRTEFVWD